MKIQLPAGGSTLCSKILETFATGRAIYNYRTTSPIIIAVYFLVCFYPIGRLNNFDRCAVLTQDRVSKSYMPFLQRVASEKT